tara:strand:+ start:237 stop:533 length:297 start_codon:yes stop_codon:yes gene_type:complete
MDSFLQESSEYNQFIIVGGIVLVFIILYIGYKHYMKQQYIENLPNKLNGSVSSSIDRSPMNQQKSILIFIPSITFQGERKGYKYGKGDKGLGYYLDKK